jgi:hypothetical protein
VTANRGQELESGITTFDPPSRVDFEVTGRLMDVAGSFTFTASGAGTALAIEFEPHPKRIMKLLFPLLSPVIRRDLRTQHREAQPGTPTRG